MFLVGLDIVGDKLMEINVFSPGGLGSAQKFTKVNFSRYVIDALERKVRVHGVLRAQLRQRGHVHALIPRVPDRRPGPEREPTDQDRAFPLPVYDRPGRDSALHRRLGALASDAGPLSAASLEAAFENDGGTHQAGPAVRHAPKNGVPAPTVH